MFETPHYKTFECYNQSKLHRIRDTIKTLHMNAHNELKQLNRGDQDYFRRHHDLMVRRSTLSEVLTIVNNEINKIPGVKEE